MVQAIRHLRNPEYSAKDIGKEIILYDADQKVIHVLNHTAVLVWQLCDGEHSLEEIEQAVRERYAVPEGYDLAGDIDRTIKIFAEKDLILVPSSGS